MILFGSRARGNSTRWSDFDLVIVSSYFEGMSTFHRSVGFRKYWDLDYPVDFLCYTPTEFQRLKNQVSIVREAIENGIEI
jgi:predicted nucleotidyltransferase